MRIFVHIFVFNRSYLYLTHSQTKFSVKNLATSFCSMVQKVFRYIGPFRRRWDSVTDRQTDG